MTPTEARAATPYMARYLASVGLTLCADAFPWVCFEMIDPLGRRLFVSSAVRGRIDSLNHLVDVDVLETYPGPHTVRPLARGVRVEQAVALLEGPTTDSGDHRQGAEDSQGDER